MYDQTTRPWFRDALAFIGMFAFFALVYAALTVSCLTLHPAGSCGL